MNRTNRRHGGAARRRPHLLRTVAAPQNLAPLFAALATAGLRAGWLELRQPAVAELPPSLEAAAAAGAARAVTAGGGRAVALKVLRGAPVLRDLLREHFAGCAVVLALDDAGEHGVTAPTAALAPLAMIGASGASGASGAGGAIGTGGAIPTLAPEGDGWRVELPPPATAPLRLTTADLVARLRRPRPWASAAAADRRGAHTAEAQPPVNGGAAPPAGDGS